MQWLPHRNISGGKIMATIKEIAQRAGVSTTTVSNVIHGKTKSIPCQYSEDRESYPGDGLCPENGTESSE
ncbi:MAG: LacI family DNA-binding transcriptional regulator [Blautia sp.]